MKTVILPAVLACSSLFTPLLAEAACTQTGTIIRVVMRDASSTGKHAIDLRVDALDTFYYHTVTSDPNLAQAAILLNSLGTPVTIRGKRSTCGTGTDRSMGNADYIIASP